MYLWRTGSLFRLDQTRLVRVCCIERVLRALEEASGSSRTGTNVFLELQRLSFNDHLFVGASFSMRRSAFFSMRDMT